MLNHVLFTFLFSISPLGEARLGIPYGMVQGLSPVLALIIGLAANLLVYPLFIMLIDFFNTHFRKFRTYKLSSLKLMQRAKKGAGKGIQKYGFWGLMIFVMIPLPITGAYMGTIAAAVFNIPRKKAFAAISLGILFSCIIVTLATHWGIKGITAL